MHEQGNGTAALHALWEHWQPVLYEQLGRAMSRVRGGAARDDVQQQYHLCTYKAVCALAARGQLTEQSARGAAKRAYLHSVSRALPRAGRRPGGRAAIERRPADAGHLVRFDPFSAAEQVAAPGGDPATVAEKRELLARLFSSLNKTTRKRLKLLAIGHTGHYVACLTGCTDGRISQLRSEAAQQWAALDNPE